MSSIKSEPKQSIFSHGKLGFFDSGVGGLAVMAEFRALYPELDMVYFGDRANCPYGDRTPEEILALTIAGIARLVEAGCVIVILACNTAAAHAIVYLQSVVYPPGCGIKVLGVTVPGVEAALRAFTVLSSISPDASRQSSRIAEQIDISGTPIGVLATQVTVDACVYSRKITAVAPETRVIEVAIPGLVDLIESGANISTTGAVTLSLTPSTIIEIRTLLHRQLSLFAAELTGQTLPTTLILGCTHYPLMREHIERIWRKLYNAPIAIIDPGKEAARRFEEYLEKHREFTILQTNMHPLCIL